MAARTLRRLGAILLALLLLLLVLLALLVVALRGSLPALSGDRELAGLADAVTIARDSDGVPSVEATTIEDVDRALGFLHAQDRYFQMDLLRRSAAGELSELFGRIAVQTDRDLRRHDFRVRARAAYAAEAPALRARFDAYVEGVRAGLDALRTRPFEYLLLRQKPRVWNAEDCYLVLFAMFLDLQSQENELDLARATLRSGMPELAAFLLAESTPWDAPLAGEPSGLPPIPASLRAGRTDGEGAAEERPERGSNAFALGAARTASGSALLASDMHLGLRLPNIWYRAHLRWADGRADGLTLPGAPGMVAGSNGHLAWSFTNSYADAVDWVRLPADAALSPRAGRIEVAHAAAESCAWFDTAFGPSRAGRRALAWVAHRPGGANLRLLEMMATSTLEDALDLLPRCGIPAQNVLLASEDGRIAWTIAGRLPRRSGCDGSEPWDADSECWRGLVDPDSIPRIVRGPEGQLWSANARPLVGDGAALLGDAGYALGARASQIRDQLTRLQSATPADLLEIQLDDRALFLTPWRNWMLEVLVDPEDPLRSLLIDWDGRASSGSAAYRIVREFRLRTRQWLLASWLAPLESDLVLEDLPRQTEAAVIAVLRERPLGALPEGMSDWDALLRSVVDSMRDELPEDPATWTWGAYNRLRMQHPLAGAVGPLSKWLRAPAESLPGDAYMPRVQRPGFGASNRFVVAPGREGEGILELPGGVSGHPLSAHFLRGHERWVGGEPSSFLPLPPVTTLRLRP